MSVLGCMGIALIWFVLACTTFFVTTAIAQNFFGVIGLDGMGGSLTLVILASLFLPAIPIGVFVSKRVQGSTSQDNQDTDRKVHEYPDMHAAEQARAIDENINEHIERRDHTDDNGKNVMKQCPFCQHENPEGSQFCTTCGSHLDTQYKKSGIPVLGCLGSLGVWIVLFAIIGIAMPDKWFGSESFPNPFPILGAAVLGLLPIVVYWYFHDDDGSNNEPPHNGPSGQGGNNFQYLP